MADTVIENLITKLSFDFDEEKMEAFNQGIEDAAKGLTAIVAGAIAAATAIFAFTKKVAESNDQLGKFARSIGVDVEALQELGFVAELNGSSIDSMNNSLKNLSRIASEAARGIGAGVEAFGILGLSVTNANGRIKNADDLILDVADAISKLNTQAEKIELMQKLGISDDLLLSIQKGSEEIKRIREEARELGFVIDKDAAEAAADFNDELLRVKKSIQGVASAIATRLMKQFTPMIKMWVEWFKINKEMLQQNISLFLDKVMKAIRGVFNVARRVVSIITSLVDAMGGWKNAIVAVTGLLIAMNASALLMPILAVAAGAGILLILEDIITFAKGGDSAIGELADKFPVLDKLLRGTLQVLGMIRAGWVLIFTQGDDAFEGMMMMIQDLRDEFKLLDLAITGILDLFNMIVEGWRLIFTEGDQALEGLILLIKDVGNAISEFIMTPISGAVSLLNKIPGVEIGGVANTLVRTQTERGRAERFGLPSRSGRSFNTTNNTTNNPHVNININGGNTEEVKRVVTDVLNEQYSGAQTNLESQVEF